MFFGRPYCRIVSVMVFASICCISLPAQTPKSDLGDLSLADLANTTVTSVAKKPQRLSQAPAAIFVISRDDIKRSGAMFLPEVLRLSPGIQVARINATEWAVTARGFDGRWSNKLLVLIDGRTVYDPLFSGVYWDEQLVPLEDVERIEVIRGPGATMWGANAVNGVINIITRSALDTQGTSVTVSAGDLDRGDVSVRHGGMLGKTGSYRVYSQFVDRQWDSQNPGTPGSWRDVRGGFRADWRTARDTFMVSGDMFGSSIHDNYLPVRSAGNPFPRSQDLNSSPQSESLLFHWERKTGDNSSIGVHMSYAHTAHDEVDLLENRDTIDTDLQQRLQLGSRNDLIWGVEFKTSADSFTQRENVAFTPNKFRDNTVSGFVQDEIALVPQRLSVVIGMKLERDSFMQKPEPEPGIQLLWTPTQSNTFWTSISRAVRAPARSDTGFEIALDAFPIPYGSWVTPILVSNPKFQPEKLTAYEAGYRFQSAKLSLDLSTFANRYDQLRSVESNLNPTLPIVVAPPPVFPLVYANNQYGNGLGFEVNSAYDLSKSVRLLADYSYLQLNLADRRGSTDTGSGIVAGEAPKHQGRLTSYWNLNSRISLDNSLYFMDRLPSQAVPGYVSLVSHVGVQIKKGFAVNFVGDNLLDHRHLEFASTLDRTGRLSQVFGRTVRAGFTWQF